MRGSRGEGSGGSTKYEDALSTRKGPEEIATIK